VKSSPLFPSPVKAKKGLSFTHNERCISELRVKVKGEGKNFELAVCAMRRGVSVRAYGCADEETVGDTGTKERASFQKKREEEEKRRGVSKESPQVFIRPLPFLKNRNIFLSKSSIVRN